MTLLQHHTLALALTASTTLGLGTLVFAANPRKTLNRVFALYSAAITLWGTMELALIQAQSQSTTRIWHDLEWLGVAFIAPSFFHTVCLLTGRYGQRETLLLRVGYLAGGSFFILNFLAPGIVTQQARPVAYTQFFGNLAPAGFYLLAVFLVLVNTGLFKLQKAYKAAEGRRRVQLRYLFWSTLVGYVGGTPDWLLTFGIYIPFLNPFGIYAIPLYSIVTTYAVVQHQLFEFNLVIRKSLVYSILVTLLTAGYFGIIYGVERFFKIAFGYQSLWLSLTAFALMALLFQPLKIGIQRFVDWLIFRVPQQEMVRRMEKLEGEARKTEKLKSVATLAAGLCHELRNPLQTIRTHAEFLPERYNDPAFRNQCVEVMRAEIGRIDEFLKQLMEFAKPKSPAFRPVEPHKILDSTLDLLGNEFLKRRIHLHRQYQANGARLHGDPDQLRQVILNLILNALEAIGQEGEILVKTDQENGWFILEVTDTGPGIDPKILSKLFEPFTTSKPDGNGLGLSIVHNIVREHGGKISAQSHPGQNTTFTVTLPVL